MKVFIRSAISICVIVFAAQGCGPKKLSEENEVKKAVKEVVTQPFTMYEGAKESLKSSGDKTKTNVEDLDKELKQ
jgi:hypothetical protein